MVGVLCHSQYHCDVGTAAKFDWELIRLASCYQMRIVHVCHDIYVHVCYDIYMHLLL